jgi:hypothetical protein
MGEGDVRRKPAAAFFSGWAGPLSLAAPVSSLPHLLIFARAGGSGRAKEYRFASVGERSHEVEDVYLIPVGFRGFGGIWTGV